MARYVALLRGINLGGKNKLPMAKLVRAFEAAGASDVRTYVQSGNVVFAAAATEAAPIVAAVVAGIREREGISAPIVLMTVDEVAEVLDSSPFLRAGAAPESVHFAFLSDAPSAARVAALAQDRSPGDAFAVDRRVVHLHLPNGVARTKLTNAWLDAQLATVSTLRNLRTVRALVELGRSA